MKNLIRTDIYKMLHMKSLYVCGFICLALSVASLYLLEFSSIILTESMNEFGSDPSLTAALAELSGSGQSWLAFGSSTLLFSAIIISLFVGSEFAQGTIKNTASKSFSRTKIYLSKVIVSVATTTVLLVLNGVLTILFATILWGFGSVDASYYMHIAKVIVTQLLLNAAYISVYVFICFTLKKSGASIAINILLINFASIVVSLLDLLINKITGFETTLTDYLISTNIMFVGDAASTNGDIIQGLLVAIVFLALTCALGCLSFHKSDIK